MGEYELHAILNTGTSLWAHAMQTKETKVHDTALVTLLNSSSSKISTYLDLEKRTVRSLKPLSDRKLHNVKIRFTLVLFSEKETYDQCACRDQRSILKHILQRIALELMKKNVDSRKIVKWRYAH